MLWVLSYLTTVDGAYGPMLALGPENISPLRGIVFGQALNMNL